MTASVPDFSIFGKRSQASRHTSRVLPSRPTCFVSAKALASAKLKHKSDLADACQHGVLLQAAQVPKSYLI